MSHLSDSLPITPFADMVFVEGRPDQATGFWHVADDQTCGIPVPTALRADMAALEGKFAAANLDIHCQFFGPLFRGERRFAVPGQAREWRFFYLADDPLWQNSRGFPLPDATRAELERIIQSVSDLTGELYIAHLVEVKPGPPGVRSTWEELAPAPSQWTINASAQLGRVADQAVRVATLPIRGAVASVTAAAAVGIAAGATVGAVGFLAALDPILLLGRVAPGRPLVPGEMAAFYPLAKWIYM